MGGSSPAYIFIARHGSRLDAADKEWHLTSPNPYDPPLTYGGWQQSRALGARIARILLSEASTSSLEPAASAAAVTSSTPFPIIPIPATSTVSSAPGPERSPPRTRRFKIVIHSSPFLRCVQTSVAIAAGIAQLSPSSIIAQTVSGTDSRFKRSVLRLDSFLGEWLTPEYFENITPPPSSSLLLASAKAGLLRHEDYSRYVRPVTPGRSPPLPPSRPSSGGALWSGRMSPTTPDSASFGLDAMKALATTLPDTLSDSKLGYVPPTPLFAVGPACKIPDGFVAHAKDACLAFDYQWDSSWETLGWGDGGEHGEEWAAMHRRFRKGMQHLVDWYAANENGAELVSRPPGLDGRVEGQAGGSVVDGNGSDANLKLEEGTDADIGTDTAKTGTNSGTDTETDTETETVVILVSHGAGCNAMIGAITHQPVLMDVSISSLTMAARRPSPHDHLRDDMPAKPLGNADASGPHPDALLHRSYDIKLLANTDHFRTSSSSSATSPRPRLSSFTWAGGGNMRNRGASLGAPPPMLSSFTYGDLAASLGEPVKPSSPTAKDEPTTATTGWTRIGGPAAATAASGARRASNSSVGFFTPRTPMINTTGIAPTTSVDGPPVPTGRGLGLWSSTATPSPFQLAIEDDDDDTTDDMFPDFDHRKKFASPPEDDTGMQSPAGLRRLVLRDASLEDDFPQPFLGPPIGLQPSLLFSGAEDPPLASPAGGILGMGGQSGLWSGIPRGEVKRRWTVNERGMK